MRSLLVRRKHPYVRLVAGLAVAAGIPLAAIVACGPSVQSIHEGSVRFEHCYRLDLDHNIAPSHREACWKDWMRRYTYGQSRDRIEYARRRIGSLAKGDPEPPTLDVGLEDRRSGERQFYLTVPQPTSAYAPPPPIATRFHKAESAQPANQAPGDACLVECRSERQSCLDGCTESNEAKAPEKSAAAEDARPSDEEIEGSRSAPSRAGTRGEGSSAAGGAGEASAIDSETSRASGAKDCGKCNADYRGCMKRCFN